MTAILLLFDKNFRYFLLKATLGQIFLSLFRYKNYTKAKRKRDNCNCKGLCHIDLRNPIGPSGLFQRHCIKCSNRKEAEERAANHMGHHPPISHAGHFHPTDGKGRKIPSYHYCYPPFH